MQLLPRLVLDPPQLLLGPLHDLQQPVPLLIESCPLAVAETHELLRAHRAPVRVQGEKVRFHRRELQPEVLCLQLSLQFLQRLLVALSAGFFELVSFGRVLLGPKRLRYLLPKRFEQTIQGLLQALALPGRELEDLWPISVGEVMQVAPVVQDGGHLLSCPVFDDRLEMAFDNGSTTGAGQARYEEVIPRLVHLAAAANSFERPFLTHKALERRQVRRALEAEIIGVASPAELLPGDSVFRRGHKGSFRCRGVRKGHSIMARGWGQRSELAACASSNLVLPST